MNMTADWSNDQAFRRHREDMLSFRRAHAGSRGIMLPVLNRTPVPCNTRRHASRKSDFDFRDSRGRPVVVPIWRIEPVKGTEN